jgi:tripartite-type tricarboxylate transporter receptor subunit TctC
MKLPRRQFLGFASGLAASPVVSRIASAQAYPSRPITMIIPYAAGGPVDTLARFMTERMRTALGQPVVIENVTGANGSIGVGRVARAAPDGYTIVAGISGTHVFNAAIYMLPYDVFGDFEPVALLTNNFEFIVVRNSVPANDLKGFIAWSKSSPSGILAGTAGVGSPQHVFGILFERITGARLEHVHYRGGAPAMQDLLSGQIDMIIADQVTSLPQIRAGNIKAFAFTGESRSAMAPEIPTTAEAGLPEFYCSVWNGIWAPKSTPKTIIARLSAAVMAVLADASTRRQLADLGQTVVPPSHQTPEALGALQKSEIEKWWPIIKAANIKVE